MTRLNMSSKNKGVTLIELLIALVISGVLIAALYRAFISQQKIYSVQEQVADMQQNVRVSINRMMREIRMAGFGNISSVLPIDAHDGPFGSIINPTNNANNIGQHDDQLTIVGAFEQVSTLAASALAGANSILLSGAGSEFDLGNKKYICIGGLETHTITDITGNTITLSEGLINRYDTGTPVYMVKAITYRLGWDTKVPSMPVLRREDNTKGGGAFALAENIENLQLVYTLTDGSETDLPANPSNIRMVRVMVTARTGISDLEFKGGTGGFRRRTVTSNIQVRNMGLSP